MPKPRVATPLGGIDMRGYCRANGYADVVVQGGNWYCLAGDMRLQVDPSHACQWQYGQRDAYAEQRVAGDPQTWVCYAPPALLDNPTGPTGGPAPGPGPGQTQTLTGGSGADEIGCVACDGQGRFMGPGRTGVVKGIGLGNTGDAAMAVPLAAGTLSHLRVRASASDGGIWLFELWVNGRPAGLGCQINGRANPGVTTCDSGDRTLSLNDGDRVSLAVGNPGDPLTPGKFTVEWSVEFTPR